MNASTFAGPGAGRFPTANSVVNDIIRLAQGKTVTPFPLSSDVPVDNDYTAKYAVAFLNCLSFCNSIYV
jgi:homoserine dehydrogenase